MTPHETPEADAAEQATPWTGELPDQARHAPPLVPEADWLEQAAPVSRAGAASPLPFNAQFDVSEADYIDQLTPAYEDAADEEDR